PRPPRARHRRDRLGVRLPPHRRIGLRRLDRLRIHPPRRHRRRPRLAPPLRGVTAAPFGSYRRPMPYWSPTRLTLPSVKSTSSMSSEELIAPTEACVRTSKISVSSSLSLY